MTDPTPGAWTIDMDCKWQGTILDTDMTCTLTANGFAHPGESTGTTTTVVAKDELQTGEYMGTFAVITATGAAASPTPSGSAASTRSSGLAPAAALPTGAMALVGGAAGIFAAALAL
jgi:hypothetical protein